MNKKQEIKNKKYSKVFQAILLKTIKIYQKIISPILGQHCRFFPSCSAYSVLAIEKYGLFKGLTLSVWRLLRCHPLSQGGVDIP